MRRTVPFALLAKGALSAGRCSRRGVGRRAGRAERTGHHEAPRRLHVARRAAPLRCPAAPSCSPMRRTVRGSAGKGALSAGRCRRWGVGRGMSGPGAPGALEAPRRPRRAAPGSAQLRQLRRTDLVRPIYRSRGR